MKQFGLFHGILLVALLASSLGADPTVEIGGACKSTNDCKPPSDTTKATCKDKICFKKCSTAADCGDAKQGCDGACRPLCETSADCDMDKFCTKIKKVCKPRGESMDSCADISDCTPLGKNFNCTLRSATSDTGICEQTCTVSADCSLSKTPTCTPGKMSTDPKICKSGCQLESDCKLGDNAKEPLKTKCNINRKLGSGNCEQPCEKSAECFPNGETMDLTKLVCTARTKICKKPDRKGDCGTDEDCTDGQACQRFDAADDETGLCTQTCTTSSECNKEGDTLGMRCAKDKAGTQVCMQGCDTSEDCPETCIDTTTKDETKGDCTVPGGCQIDTKPCPDGVTKVKQICDTSRASATRSGDCEPMCSKPGTLDTCSQKILTEDGTKYVTYPRFCAKLDASNSYCKQGELPKPTTTTTTAKPAMEEGGKKRTPKPKPGKRPKGKFPTFLQKLLQALQQVKNYFSGSQG